MMTVDQWSLKKKTIMFGGVNLAPPDFDETSDAFFSLPEVNFQKSEFVLNLTMRQLEHFWTVMCQLRKQLAACPNRRVYHNAFNARKARVRQKNQGRARRLIERMNRT